MQEMTLEDIQRTELGLLLKYDNVCKNYDLRYSLGGGSLLGAIRHKGFIPWDDDIDVMMPRPDYDTFLKICKSNNIDLNLITYDENDGYYGLFAKIWDPSTRIKDDLMKITYDIGVNIDIFPIDGLGKNVKEAVNILKKTALKREILNATLWKKFFRSKTHSILVEPFRLALFVISRFSNPKKLLRKVDEENTRHPFETSLFAGCVCGSYRKQEIMPQKTFQEYISVEFEGYKFKAIKNYDEYLKKHYGQYMKLPPKEKQKTHHTYKAYKI